MTTKTIYTLITKEGDKKTFDSLTKMLKWVTIPLQEKLLLISEWHTLQKIQKPLNYTDACSGIQLSASFWTTPIKLGLSC